MKKFLSIAVIVVIALTMFVACGGDTVYNTELVAKGDYEAASSADSWKVAFVSSSSNKPVISNDNAYTEPDHLSNAYFKSSSADFTYLSQVVETQNKAVYKLTFDLKVEYLKSAAYDFGAVVKLAESDTVLLNVTTDDNQWHTYTVYFQPKGLETSTLRLQLGDTNNKVVGTARYDNVSLVRVKDVGDAEILVLRPIAVTATKSSDTGIWYTAALAVVSLILCVAAYVAIRRKYAIELTQKFKAFFNSPAATLAVLCVVGFAVRLLLTMFLFKNDVVSINFAKYVQKLSSYGFTVLYTKDAYAGYAPGALFTQYLLSLLMNWFKIEGNMGLVVMSRAPSLVCDIVVIFFIYYVGRKFTNDKVAAIMAALYAILPVTFTVASADALMLPVTVMLLMITFVAILDKKYISMFIAYLVACFFSPISLAVLPFVLAQVIYLCVKNKDKKTIITMTVGVVGSFILMYLATLPYCFSFIKDGRPFYFVEKYYALCFGSQVCVDNGFSLYAIFGLNQKAVSSAANILNILFIVALIVFTLSLYFKNRNRAELMLLASFFLIGVSVFCLNMNHTAMYMGLALLMLYAIISHDKRLFAVFTALSIISFVNVSSYLNIMGAFIGNNAEINFVSNHAMLIVGGIFAVLATIYFGYVAYDITINGRIKTIEPMREKPWPAFKNWIKYIFNIG